MSTVTIIDLYVSHGDGGENGVGPAIGAFKTHTAATEYAKGKGWYGGDGAVSHKRAILMEDGKAYILESESPVDMNGLGSAAIHEMRQKAIEKLTPYERDLLGVGTGEDSTIPA